jgi:hypothetical protein
MAGLPLLRWADYEAETEAFDAERTSGIAEGVPEYRKELKKGGGLNRKIATWGERCEKHPDHKGVVTYSMIQARMQEEIDELRKALKLQTRLFKAEQIKVEKIEGWLKYLWKWRNIYLKSGSPDVEQEISDYIKAMEGK